MLFNWFWFCRISPKFQQILIFHWQVIFAILSFKMLNKLLSRIPLRIFYTKWKMNTLLQLGISFIWFLHYCYQIRNLHNQQNFRWPSYIIAKCPSKTSDEAGTFVFVPKKVWWQAEIWHKHGRVQFDLHRGQRYFPPHYLVCLFLLLFPLPFHCLCNHVMRRKCFWNLKQCSVKFACKITIIIQHFTSTLVVT